jgi:hypothetical protein
MRTSSKRVTKASSRPQPSGNYSGEPIGFPPRPSPPATRPPPPDPVDGDFPNARKPGRPQARVVTCRTSGLPRPASANRVLPGLSANEARTDLPSATSIRPCLLLFRRSRTRTNLAANHAVPTRRVFNPQCGRRDSSPQTMRPEFPIDPRTRRLLGKHGGSEERPTGSYDGATNASCLTVCWPRRHGLSPLTPNKVFVFKSLCLEPHSSHVTLHQNARCR